LLVAVTLAVAVSAVAAGPAVAAKGGNNDNAHACQQGGHENRFEAETGRPFKNAGDCASHGAKGGAASALFLTNPSYPCQSNPMATCWGAFAAIGLDPKLSWIVFVSAGSNRGTIVDQGFPAQDGSVGNPPVGPPIRLQVPCDQDLTPLEATAETMGDMPSDITSAPVDSPCG
jgi:hypothetical protein